MKAWTESTVHLRVIRAESGWIIVRNEAGPQRHGDTFVAGVADDEGLVEWFADQLSLPSPRADGEEPGNTVENLSADLRKVQDELAALEWARGVGPFTRNLHERMREALKPVAVLLNESREIADSAFLKHAFHDTAIHEVDEEFSVGLHFGELRAIVRAAGLWTPDMEPATPPPPSVEQLNAAVAASETQARPPNDAGPDATQAEASQQPPPAERADYPGDGENPDERESGFRKTFGGERTDAPATQQQGDGDL